MHCDESYYEAVFRQQGKHRILDKVVPTQVQHIRAIQSFAQLRV